MSPHFNILASAASTVSVDDNDASPATYGCIMRDNDPVSHDSSSHESVEIEQFVSSKVSRGAHVSDSMRGESGSRVQSLVDIHPAWANNSMSVDESIPEEEDPVVKVNILPSTSVEDNGEESDMDENENR